MTSSGLAEGILDSQAMFAATAALPDQLRAGVELARGIAKLPKSESLRSIVVIGMGGSGVAGEVLAALGAPILGLPVQLVNSYDLPRFVDASSLVFAVSFSGDTEETLAATKDALARGAQVVAVSSGGALAVLAEQEHLALARLPADIPQPRVSLGASLAPLLVVLERIGLFPGASDAISDAIDQLVRRRDALIAPGGGLAVELARRIAGRFPFIYGASGIGAVAARRWKTQVNENAKLPAFFAVQPEASHNEIVGYGQGGDITRQILALVQLRSDFEHPRVALRFGLVEEALREVVAEVLEVRAEGSGPLAQLLDLILIGDFVSLHLAVQAGIDPGPVPLLGEIKQALRSIG